MTDTLHRAPNQEYYDRVAALSTVPFWQLGEMHEPSGPERPHVWRWDEVVPELLRSQHLEGEAAGDAAAPGAPVAQPRLDAARLRRHAHAGRRLPDAAARRVGSGARPLVLGVALRGLGRRRPHGGRRSPCPDAPGRPRCSPRPGAGTGTCTPAATSPSCGSTGSTCRCSSPCAPASTGSRRRASTGRRSATPTGTEATGLGLVPAGHRADRHSPVRRYPWDEAYPALQRPAGHVRR